MIYRAFYGHSEWVFVTAAEIDAAIEQGKQMRAESIAAGHKNQFGFAPDDAEALRAQCLGVVAERAVIVALGVDDAPKSGTYRAADLVGNVEVRSLKADYYGLRIYDKDIRPDEGRPRRVVGVIIRKGYERNCSFRIPGWYPADAPMESEWWIAPNNRPPFCAVPQHRLFPLATLRDALRAEGFKLNRL